MKKEKKYTFESNVVGVSIVLATLILLGAVAFLLQSCTLTLQNTIASHSNDAVDSEQVNEPNISPDLSIPLIK